MGYLFLAEADPMWKSSTVLSKDQAGPRHSSVPVSRKLTASLFRRTVEVAQSLMRAFDASLDLDRPRWSSLWLRPSCFAPSYVMGCARAKLSSVV